MGGATCASNWQDASACMKDNFLTAAMTNWWSVGSRRAVNEGLIFSWQNSIVVDPGDASYHDFLIEQLVRHIELEDAFAGIVIDRSDWMDHYNLLADDGVTFVPETVKPDGSGGIVASLKVSYASIIADLRGAMTAALATKTTSTTTTTTPLGQGIMLMNCVGNARIDMLRHYDGGFSEGYAINAAGLLGLRMPSILWTKNANECCSTADKTASFMQHHLYMGVAPMAPFPGNDHAITWDPLVAGLYARYGPLFGALRARTWALFPHIARLDNASSKTYAKVNAFVVPYNSDPSSPSPSLVLSIMMGEAASGSVGVSVKAFDRVFAATGLAAHPLLREGRVSVGTGIDTRYALEVMTPGLGASWMPLPGMPSFTCGSPGGAPCDLIVPVTLFEGCALVRIR